MISTVGRGEYQPITTVPRDDDNLDDDCNNPICSKWNFCCRMFFWPTTNSEFKNYIFELDAVIYFTFTESLIGLTIVTCLVLIPAIILITITGEADHNSVVMLGHLYLFIIHYSCWA